MKVHRILDASPGCNGETLCHMRVSWVRDDAGSLLKIVSSKTQRPIKCVWDGGEVDFNCNTCKHVWRNITRG